MPGLSSPPPCGASDPARRCRRNGRRSDSRRSTRARKWKTVVSTGWGDGMGLTSSPPMSFQASCSRSWTSKQSEKLFSSIPSRAESFFITEARTSGVAKYLSRRSARSRLVSPAKWSSWQWVWNRPSISLMPIPKRGQAVLNVGAGIDQIDRALKHQDDAHAGAVGVPAVALAGMDDGEIFPIEPDEAPRV